MLLVENWAAHFDSLKKRLFWFYFSLNLIQLFVWNHLTSILLVQDTSAKCLTPSSVAGESEYESANEDSNPVDEGRVDEDRVVDEELAEDHSHFDTAPNNVASFRGEVCVLFFHFSFVLYFFHFKDAIDSKVKVTKKKRNPQYIPKKGHFYEHDDRNGEQRSLDTEEENILNADVCDEGSSMKLHSDEIISNNGDNDKSVNMQKESSSIDPQERKFSSKKPLWESTDKWQHDLFDSDEQKPKATEELVEYYGFNIRSEESAPRWQRSKYVKPKPSRRFGDENKNASWSAKNSRNEITNRSSHSSRGARHIRDRSPISKEKHSDDFSKQTFARKTSPRVFVNRQRIDSGTPKETYQSKRTGFQKAREDASKSISHQQKCLNNNNNTVLSKEEFPELSTNGSNGTDKPAVYYYCPPKKHEDASKETVDGQLETKQGKCDQIVDKLSSISLNNTVSVDSTLHPSPNDSEQAPVEKSNQSGCVDSFSVVDQKPIPDAVKIEQGPGTVDEIDIKYSPTQHQEDLDHQKNANSEAVFSNSHVPDSKTSPGIAKIDKSEPFFYQADAYAANICPIMPNREHSSGYMYPQDYSMMGFYNQVTTAPIAYYAPNDSQSCYITSPHYPKNPFNLADTNYSPSLGSAHHQTHLTNRYLNTTPSNTVTNSDATRFLPTNTNVTPVPSQLLVAAAGPNFLGQTYQPSPFPSGYPPFPANNATSQTLPAGYPNVALSKAAPVYPGVYRGSGITYYDIHQQQAVQRRNKPDLRIPPTRADEGAKVPDEQTNRKKTSDNAQIPVVTSDK